MVFIFADFGTYSKDADEVEKIIKKHNHLDYEKCLYSNHTDILGDLCEKVSMTWFRINGCTRSDLESLYEDLDKSDIHIALEL